MSGVFAVVSGCCYSMGPVAMLARSMSVKHRAGSNVFVVFGHGPHKQQTMSGNRNDGCGDDSVGCSRRA